MIGNHPKRRKADKLPPEWAREFRLQELCNRQDEELRLVRAENTRLRTENARLRGNFVVEQLVRTRPMELAA